MRIWCKQHESMDPSCLASIFQAAAAGVMMWRILVMLMLVNAMLKLKPISSDGYFQQDNVPCHKAHPHSTVAHPVRSW